MVSREDLYELVWSEPMIKVAEKFNVSGSYMARVCSTLHVPRPERGYWAKLAVGKAPEKPPLPEAQPGDQLSWSQDGELQSSPRNRLAAASPRPPRKKLLRLVTGVHGLIRDAKGNYDTGYKVEEGQLLRPYKRLMVDVTASQAGLDKALAFANDLFNALESAGHRILISSPAERFRRAHIDDHEQLPKVLRNEQSYDYSRLWSPQRPTVVYVGPVAFGLAIIEMSESVVLRYLNGKYIRESDYKPSKAALRYGDHSWTTTKDTILMPSRIGTIDLTCSHSAGAGPTRIIRTAEGIQIRAFDASELALYDPDALQVFSRRLAKDLVPGDQVCVFTPDFIDTARQKLHLSATAPEILTLYHKAVAEAAASLRGYDLTAKAETLRNLIMKIDPSPSLPGLQSVRQWIDVAELPNTPRDEVRPQAPRDRRHFLAFMKALGIAEDVALHYWDWGVFWTRSMRIRSGSAFHQLFMGVLIDPHGAISRLPEAHHQEVWRIYETAEEHLVTVTSNNSEGRYGGLPH